MEPDDACAAVTYAVAGEQQAELTIKMCEELCLCVGSAMSELMTAVANELEGRLCEVELLRECHDKRLEEEQTRQVRA